MPLPVRLVLLRPRNPQNLGAVARAMKNFGIDDWAVVDPRTFDFATARRVAVHAEDVLDRPRVVAGLEEAVADCVWTVGTSSRQVRGKRRLTPAQVAREAVERAATGRIALVFGDERSGLSNEEIDRCHDLSFIPTEKEQPSLNLAQALVIYCHALHEAAQPPCTSPPGPVGATDAELSRLEQVLAELLRRGGFLVGEGERHALGDLTATLRRARLSRAELKLWETALRSVTRRVGEPHSRD